MSQNEYEERKPIIYLAGIGMGQDDQLTGEVLDCLDRADAVMGARRMLDAAAPYTEGKAVLAAYKPSEMVNWLSSFEWDEAVLVLSGDTGFYSGAEAASKAFLQEGWEVEYIPGVSSLSYFCARLGRSWQNGDFSKGSIIKILMRLAIPMTLAQLMNVLYNVVDRMFIGRIGGDSMDALTGVGVCLPMITIVIAFANLVGMGGAPLFSIERGKKNEREAEYILGNCVVLFLIFAVVLTVAGLIFKRPLLMLLGASEVTLPYAEQYITIYLLGTIFVMFGLGLNNFINAQGFAKIGMCTTVIGAALNIALDPIFIFVLNMGVRGAAIATVISQAAAAKIVKNN